MLTNGQLDELLREAEEEALHDWTVVSLHMRITDARELVAAARRARRSESLRIWNAWTAVLMCLAVDGEKEIDRLRLQCAIGGINAAIRIVPDPSVPVGEAHTVGADGYRLVARTWGAGPGTKEQQSGDVDIGGGYVKRVRYDGEEKCAILNAPPLEVSSHSISNESTTRSSHAEIRELIEANGKLIKEFSAAVQVPREGSAAAYELVERELFALCKPLPDGSHGLVTLSTALGLVSIARCGQSGKGRGSLLAAVEAAKKRGER